MRRYHDMGGLPAGAVDLAEPGHSLWEKRIDAIMRLVSAPGRRLVSLDERRRAVEDLGPMLYDKLGYYERWIAAITHVLLEKGVISVDELGRRMENVKARNREAAS